MSRHRHHTTPSVFRFNFDSDPVVVATTTTTSDTPPIYYVSNSGDDSNSGTATDQAWKTINKVNSANFNPEDSILFKRGDKFDGTLKVNNSGASGSPIIYGAYGAGSKPKIYGSEEISGWTAHSGNIYKATFAKAITQLFIDDVRVRAARYPNPNEDLFKITKVNSTTQFESTDINSCYSYAGVKAHLRTNDWRLDARDVIASEGQALTIDETLPYGGLAINDEFFLVDHLAFLTEAGEWYSDGTTVYLWTPAGDTPANYTVRGATLNEGIVINTKSHITCENLDIQQQQETGIVAINSTYLTIDNNDINYPESYGIKITGGHNTVSNNTVNEINYIGLSVVDGNSIVKDNIITNIGLFDNLGINGIAGAAASPYGMNSGGDNNLIQYNRILNVGYLGLSFTGQYVSIKNNYIENTCDWLTDGGAIYTYSATQLNTVSYGSVIDGNIVIGAKDQSIYMDNNTNNVEIKNNTVIDGLKNAIFFHHNYENNAHHNTLFHNQIGVRSSTDAIPAGKTPCEFKNNTVLGPPDVGSHNSLMALMSSALTPRTTFLDYNIYINHHYLYPFKDLNGYTLRSFNGWKTTMECDTNSTLDNSRLGDREEMIFYNDTKVNKTVNLSGGTYKNTAGNTISNLILTPFTSMILIKQ